MEHRQHTRVPVSLRVSYASRGELVKDLVTNLSTGGLFVRTKKPLPIGTEIALEILIGEHDPAMNVRGKVMWLRGEKEEGMGVSFVGPLGPLLLEVVESTKK